MLQSTLRPTRNHVRQVRNSQLNSSTCSCKTKLVKPCSVEQGFSGAQLPTGCSRAFYRQKETRLGRTEVDGLSAETLLYRAPWRTELPAECVSMLCMAAPCNCGLVAAKCPTPSKRKALAELHQGLNCMQHASSLVRMWATRWLLVNCTRKDQDCHDMSEQ